MKEAQTRLKGGWVKGCISDIRNSILNAGLGREVNIIYLGNEAILRGFGRDGRQQGDTWKGSRQQGRGGELRGLRGEREGGGLGEDEDSQRSRASGDLVEVNNE